MNTTETSTEEIEKEFKEVATELLKLSYVGNEKHYNYLERRKSNLMDILNIRQDKNLKQKQYEHNRR